MSKILALALLTLLLAACGPLVSANTSDVVTGHVVDVLEVGDRPQPQTGVTQPYERVRVELDESLYRGERVDLEWTGHRALDATGSLQRGDSVLLSVTRDGDQRTYAILEIVRLPSLAPLAVVLVIALLAVARWKGLTALLGLAASVAVFLLAIVPALRGGQDPLFPTLAGSVGVILVSVFVVHGADRRSLAAVCGTTAALGFVTAAGSVALAAARMGGLGTEDQAFLQVGTSGHVDMARLALAGIMVGSLGALVDLSIGQASATMELAAADHLLRGRRLYASALNAGRDHLASLVNTVALAYFGGALPLILLLSLGYQPLAVSVNSEVLAQSVIAVMAASIGLVFAVPITTAVAVMLAGATEVPLEE